jgi:hypothetical protein
MVYSALSTRFLLENEHPEKTITAKKTTNMMVMV